MNKFKYIMLMVSCLFLGSCEDVFDVDPISEVEESVLYQEELGFYNSLYGIYLKLNQPDLYAKNMSYDVVEHLAQTYTNSDDNIEGVSTYTYNENSRLIEKFDKLWGSLYNTIANCNNLLENLEKTNLNFPEGNHEILEAETKAIRAFLHFDLLRLFGPSMASNPEGLAIPYVNDFSLQRLERSTTKNVLDRIIADLTEAEELLEVNDPLFVEGETEPEDDINTFYAQNAFRAERKTRLNYYGVQALLARVYLYAGNKEKAYEYATKVIDSNYRSLMNIPSSDSDYLSGNYTLFGLAINHEVLLQENYNRDFYRRTYHELEHLELEDLFEVSLFNRYEYAAYTQDWSIFGSNLYAEQDELLLDQNNLGNTGDNDRRLFSWINPYEDPSISNVRKAVITKYIDIRNDFQSLIKLQEMYLIAAETATTIDEGLTFLNTTRVYSGLPALDIVNIPDNDVLNTEIEKEYRKEFLAEGQIFFYYKRKNKETFQGASRRFVTAGDNVYVLPYPTEEGF